MTDAFNDHEERNVLAGELALRLLSPEDEIRARALQNTDPDFAAQVEGWNTQLAAFADGIAPVEPSAGLWPRIDAATAPVANDNGRVAAFWRTWAIGATGLLAASVGAVALLVTQAEPVVPPAPPSVVQTGVTRVATLALEDGAPILTIAYDTATGNLFLAPTTQLAGQDGVPHLWLVKPEGGVQLVGAIEPGASTRLALTNILSGVAGEATAVAISIEPRGTTPAQDTPGGPVVASGEIQQL
jgi:anti-sigma-K factor RskA